MATRPTGIGSYQGTTLSLFTDIVDCHGVGATSFNGSGQGTPTHALLQVTTTLTDKDITSVNSLGPGTGAGDQGGACLTNDATHALTGIISEFQSATEISAAAFRDWVYAVEQANLAPDSVIVAENICPSMGKAGLIAAGTFNTADGIAVSHDANSSVRTGPMVTARLFSDDNCPSRFRPVLSST